MATQKQSFILTFVVKASPAFVHLSMPPQSKRPFMSAKHGPGCPKKKLRMQDLVNKAVEQDNTVKFFDAYVAHCILHYTSEKATKRDTPTKFQAFTLHKGSSRFEATPKTKTNNNYNFYKIGYNIKQKIHRSILFRMAK